MVHKFKVNRYYTLSSLQSYLVYYLIRIEYSHLKFISVTKAFGAQSIISFDTEWCKRNMNSVPLLISLLRYKL
jgi:hypothetical protein